MGGVHPSLQAASSAQRGMPYEGLTWDLEKVFTR